MRWLAVFSPPEKRLARGRREGVERRGEVLGVRKWGKMCAGRSEWGEARRRRRRRRGRGSVGLEERGGFRRGEAGREDRRAEGEIGVDGGWGEREDVAVAIQRNKSNDTFKSGSLKGRKEA
jgi:hypothetical protein